MAQALQGLAHPDGAGQGAQGLLQGGAPLQVQLHHDHVPQAAQEVHLVGLSINKGKDAINMGDDNESRGSGGWRTSFTARGWQGARCL